MILADKGFVPPDSIRDLVNLKRKVNANALAPNNERPTQVLKPRVGLSEFLAAPGGAQAKVSVRFVGR